MRQWASPQWGHTACAVRRDKKADGGGESPHRPGNVSCMIEKKKCHNEELLINSIHICYIDVLNKDLM